jgi:hypothetical protein
MINETPIIRAPINTYCRRLPHLDFVLSEINPIIGSVIESKILGASDTTPHIHPGKPKF